MNGEEEKEQEKEVNTNLSHKEVVEKVTKEINKEEVEAEEESLIDFLKRFQPSTWVILGMIVIIIILAWAFGYYGGYSDCLVMHNAKMANCTVF